MKNSKSTAILPAGLISRNIYFLREARVMLDTDLARLYGVTTANLNKAVRRNLDRFPEDFMFQIDKTELDALIFQSGISKPSGRGGTRHPPYAFTEQGVAMLSSVLRSERAVKVNIAIMRAFVQLREMLATNQQLRRKIEEMEKRYDTKFHIVFAAIKRMLEAPKPTCSTIGFHASRERKDKTALQSALRIGKKSAPRA
ncbi:MAG TPA: ORF6N domain-containing protein [Candidatus Acidoferrum sp.]|nr:ORF6N domain-containing protein [Candidatus Acidoferrum sp.]